MYVNYRACGCVFLLRSGCFQALARRNYIRRNDFVPADCKVLEEKALEFDVKFLPQENEFISDINEKIVYQGMRVKKGRAVVEAIRTADTTYLGSLVKKIDTKNTKMKKRHF